MLLLLFLSSSLALALSSPSTREQFLQFQREHGRQYSTRAEEELRFSIFEINLSKAEEHNRSGSSWTEGLTEFSDLTEGEFQAQHLGGYRRTGVASGGGYRRTGLTGGGNHSMVKSSRTEMPDTVDWREQGVITQVKNQGGCGSCWAFAATQQIESYSAIQSGHLTELSTQQVTSCTPNPLQCGGQGACGGSIPQLGFSYIQLFGHTTEADYPYTSNGGGDRGCLFDLADKTPVVGLTGYNTLLPNSQDKVLGHLAYVGPLAIAVDASQWFGYVGGVFSGCSYSGNIGLNHAVQLVGYGTDPQDGDFWLVRNSWGANWGEQGYIRLARESSVQCGVDSTPMSGTACVGGPGTTSQTVCGQCGLLFDVSYPLGAHGL